jgi:dihydrofolate synthase / folylpolyglutamate synthase
VITSIGLDHMAQLGDTVEAIAFEKAGIIKPGVRCISGVPEPGPRDVIRRVARDVGAPLTEVHAAYPGPVGLPGDHQRRNAALAVATVEELRRGGLRIPDAAVTAGLESVQWPARVQVLRREPMIVLDCAHNVPSAVALVQTLAQVAPTAARKHCVFAVSQDKQYAEMLRVLAGYFNTFHLTQYSHNPRCVPAASLVPLVSPAAARVTLPAATALAEALAEISEKDLLCITGSVFLAGELAATLSQTFGV